MVTESVTESVDSEIGDTFEDTRFFGVAELLLEHGANVHVQNKDGLTPLHLAALGGHTGVAKLLFERGANVDVQNNEGKTPLQVAPHCQWVKDLLSGGLLNFEEL